MIAVCRAAAIVCAALAVCLAGFAVWGLGTEAGQRSFDEMAGLIPMAAGMLGLLLAACAAVAGLLTRRASRRRH